MIHDGSCHCGRVAFKVEGDFTEAMECNCSMCRRKGTLLAFVPRGQLTLTTPEADYSTYLFNKHVIAHHFCPVCGVAPFADGQMPDGTKMAAVNVRCLPDVDLTTLKITQFDGASK
jgi:hypothetical protein